MEYIELILPIAEPERAEILMAELAELPYESFEHEGGVLRAYIQREQLADCKAESDALLARYGVEGARYVAIESQNWNAQWEEHFTPVEVDRRLRIRAPFHAAAEGYELEVLITPRMAFGSGHHATTCLVATGLMDMELHGLHGLDVGCGTGVLSIIALRRGAEAMDAVDIDEWSVENCRENAAANGVAERIEVLHGNVRRVAGHRYDLIAANINRNTLLAQIEAYAALLQPGGQLLMSGFLTGDVEAIAARAAEYGLQPVGTREREGWAMVQVIKK